MDWSQLTPDQAAAVQAALGQAQAQTPGSQSQAPITHDQAMQLLVDAYNKSGGKSTPYIENFGSQYGITLDDIKATSDARHKQYSGGMDVIDWTKDLAGLVGVVGGASALAGGLGGAAASGGGAGVASGAGASDLLPGAGVLAPAAGVPATVGQAALAGAGLPAGLGGASTTAAAPAAGAASGGGVSGWLKLGNQLRGLLPQPRRQQPQQNQMANLLQSSDPSRSALVQQLLARALRNG